MHYRLICSGSAPRGGTPSAVLVPTTQAFKFVKQVCDQKGA